MYSKNLMPFLKKGVIGFPGTLASSVGMLMASPTILTATSGFGMGGDNFALALLLAFIMMQAQVTTFSEAAAIMPTTGSAYDYIACGMGRFFAIVGAICAYIIVHVYAATAETILAGIMALANFESLMPGVTTHEYTWMLGVGMVILFAFLNALGIEIFSKIEVVLTFGMGVTLLVFCVMGLILPPKIQISGWFGTSLNIDNVSNFLGFVGMAMFLFVGIELVTPMAPHIKNAHKTIPRAMATGLSCVALCFLLYGAAMSRQIENNVINTQTGMHLFDTPLALPAFADSVMGHFGQYWLGFGLILAGAATINTLMAAVPRIIYSMALDGALPGFLAWKHPKYDTPVFAIAVAAIIPCLHAWYLHGNVDRILPLILAAVCAWGVAYLLVTISVINLRIKRPDLKRPYKSPCFPIPQVLSSVGIIVALLNITPPGMKKADILIPFLIMLAIGAGYAFIWCVVIKREKPFKRIDVEEVFSKEFKSVGNENKGSVKFQTD